MADENATPTGTPEPTPPELSPETPLPVETPAPAPTELPVTEGEPIPPAPTEAQTAQMPASEPLAPEPEPIAPPNPPVPASTAPAAQNARDLLAKANARKQDRKRKKLEKILEALNARGKITNDEVEKLLHVSDATATRYLSILEKEGKIKQEGRTGKSVVYTKV